MHKEVFIQSWKDLKNNLILFIPDIIILIVNLILGILFLKFSGLLSLLTDPEIILKELETSIPVIKLFFKENLLKIIISFALFISTSFIIGSGLAAMKLGMMKDVVNKKRLTLKKMMDYGTYIWQVVLMKIIIFVIGLIMFLFILGTVLILSTLINGGLVILVTAIFFPLLIIVLQLLLFFRYQMLFLESKHPIAAVKNSFEYFLKNKKYVLIVWLIIFVISFITAPLSTYLGFTQEKITYISAAMLLGYIIRHLMNMVINVWSELFKFESYKVKPLKP